MDVFGNEVDQDGDSIDVLGRRIDPERYLWVRGVPQPDRDRDMQYTRELGGRVVESFLSNNVLYPLHLVSFALFEHLRRQHPRWDLYRTLRFSRGEVISRAVAEGETERVLRLARRAADEGRFRLHQSAWTTSPRDMVQEALRYYRTYHTSPIAEMEHGQIRLMSLKLLYFYSNRLRGYDLERKLHRPGGYG
jgi:glycerol-3-phosphate O-acyltransferase